MNNEQKLQIAQSASAYMAEKGLTASQLAQMSGINESYLSMMLNGKFETVVSGKTVVIAPKYWVKLAAAVGLKVEKEYWGTVQTVQFSRLVHELKEAKEQHVCKTLIGEPGSGKTYGIGRFQEALPKHTFVITINSLVSVNDIILMLMEKVGVYRSGSNALRLSTLIVALREMKQKGGSPVVIFDEAENMNPQTMKMLKGLYDGIKDYAAMVLVGTDQLIDKIRKAKAGNKEAGPQFFRRFMPAVRYLSTVDSKFTDFFAMFNINDKALQKLLCRLATNYGELNLYLEPVLRQADLDGVEVTLDFFKLVHGMD